MSRNTVRRVEVAAPVEDEKLKKQIREMFATLMADNVKARVMLPDGSYVHAEPAEGEERINAQEVLFDKAAERLHEKQIKQERLRKNREKGAAEKAKKSAAKKSPAPKKPRKKKSADNDAAD